MYKQELEDVTIIAKRHFCPYAINLIDQWYEISYRNKGTINSWIDSPDGKQNPLCGCA